MNKQAHVVIVGAGIVGAAAAYHLTKFGWRDVLLLDKGNLFNNDGSTSHAPGGVVAINHSKLMTRFAQYSTELYARLPEYNHPRRTYNAVGSFELARTRERWQDLKRLHNAAESYEVETHLLSSHQAQKMWPIINPDAFEGVLHIPSSALVSGECVTGSMALAAQATGGCEIVPNTHVASIEIEKGRVTAVLTDNPFLPRIECRHVLLCTNIWGPVLSDQLQVRLPLLAFEHQYVITEPVSELSRFNPENRDDEAVLPFIRDLDRTMYYRNHWSALGVGSYWHKPLPVDPYDLQKKALKPFTPDDFEEAKGLAEEMIPTFKGKPLATQFNGMFAFSVDGYPFVGETHTEGVWTAVASWITHAGGVGKSIAEWMVFGEPEWDMRACNVNRLHDYQSTRGYVDTVTNANYREVYDIVHPRQPLTDPRNIRLGPFHARHESLGANFMPFAGLELPCWYEKNAQLLEKHAAAIPERSGWGAQFWSPVQGAEHLEVRDNAGVFDLTGLSIIEVCGEQAAAFLNRLCTSEMGRPVDTVIYTCWLTPKGGVKRDLTVARMAADTYWLFVGEGTLPQDLDWVRRQTADDSSVAVRDISGLYSALGLWGPNARTILSQVTGDDIRNDSFPYFSARWIEIGAARVYAMRISYVGELGWELHIPYEQSLSVWDAIWEAGRTCEMVAAGSAAMDSLRLEKGYRLWGGDIHTEYNLIEAGLGWTARMDKADGFIGREATAAARKKGCKKKLRCIAVDDPAATLCGYEPLFAADGTCIGHVTTANYGYSVSMNLAFGYVESQYATAGTELEVAYFGEHYPATVVADPVWDPEMSRLRS
jgi:glycine cleavage system aminomethyltransferase T/glycine/D-amino acid oxidase-like deaminating enzyme